MAVSALPVTSPVILPTNVPFILLLASSNTALSAGYVIKTLLVPDDQFTALLELELANMVVLANVVPEDVNVPNPTSKSVLSVQT